MNRAFVSLLAGVLALAAGAAVAAPRTTPDPHLSSPPPVTDPAEIGAWLKRLVGKYRFEGVIEVVYDKDETYEEHRCGSLPPKANEDPKAPPVPYCSNIKGKGDCIAIGKGPGVQCMLNVAWQDIYEMIFQSAETKDDVVDTSPTGNFEVPGGVSYLDPSVALFGVDPRNAQVNYLLVDQKGLPEGAPGSIKGNTATFKTACVNAPVLFRAMKPQADAFRTCERIFRVEAKPESKVVFWTMDLEINDDVFTRIQMTLRREAAEEAQQPAQPAKK